MTHTFRVSPASVRKTYRSIWFLPVIVGGIALLVLLRDPSADMRKGTLQVIPLIVVACVYVVWQRRRYSRWAEQHALVVTDDALLMQDGELQVRIPFSAVKHVAIRRRNSKVRGIILKCTSGREMLSVYDEIETLARLLVEKLGPDKVSTFSWFYI